MTERVGAGTRQLARWRAALVTVTLHGLMFLSVSGYLIFFYGAFIDARARIGEVHWIAGLVFAVPYAIYQLRHYLRNRNYADRLHFKLGLASFVSLTLTILSGVILIFDMPAATVLIVDLVHVVVGFALLILLSAHLVLVAKITVERLARAGNLRAQTLSRLVAWALWWPLILSSVITFALAVA